MALLFEANIDWRLLAFFLKTPWAKMYTNEIGRALKASGGAVSQACNRLSGQRFLSKEEKGNMAFYSLNRKNPFVKELNRAVLAYQLEKKELAKEFLEAFPDAHSIAAFGSRVKGTFEQTSDLDLLIISNKKEAFKGVSTKLSKELGFDIMPVFKTFLEWKKLAEKRDPFYLEILANHILLYGKEMVI